jgi:aminoglycoside phosphotransferase (APT) family kinase protein
MSTDTDLKNHHPAMAVVHRNENLAPLERWLVAVGGFKPGSRISDQKRPKTGFSADTLLLKVDDGGATPIGIVVRVEHMGNSIFLDAAIMRQAQMMVGLGKHGVCVPEVIGWSEDLGVLGAPFLVMKHSAGVSLPQHPSYYVAGYLLDLGEEGCGRAWKSALTTMAQINRTPWQGEFDFLLRPVYGRPGLSHYLGWIAAWRMQACKESHPVIDAAIAWLESRQPDEAPTELLWGDSNPGNYLFGADGTVSAVLDFEAAAIGPAEIDLAWWFMLDRMLAAGANLLPGMPDKATQIAIFEEALGRPVVNLDYYEVLAALRMSLVIARTVGLLIEAGKLPSSNRADEFNPMVSLLAGMIGIEHPAVIEDYLQMVSVMNER